MSQNQTNKAKRLWKDIKPLKNNKQSPDQSSSYIAKTEQGKISISDEKIISTHSHQLKREQEQLQQLLNQFKQSSQANKSLKLNSSDDKTQQKNKNVHENNNSEEQPLTYQQIDNNNNMQDQIRKLEDHFRQRNHESKKQESIIEQVHDLKNMDLANQQPLMHSMTGSHYKISKFFKQKLQRLHKQLLKLSSDNRSINQQIVHFITIIKQWLFNQIKQQIQNGINKIINSNRVQKNDINSIEELQIQIAELRQSNKTVTQIYQQQIIDKNQQLDILRSQVNHLENAISKIKKQFETSQEQMSNLNQQLFDYQQRIAQIDLEIDERAKQILSKEGVVYENADKQKYLKQISELYSQIEYLEQKYKNVELSDMRGSKKLEQLEQQLNQKQYALKMQENQLQANFAQLNERKNQMNAFYQELKLKQQQLRYEQKKLLKKLQQIEEKQSKIVQMTLQANRYHHSKQKQQIQPYQQHQLYDHRRYQIKEYRNDPPSFRYDRNTRNPIQISTANRRNIDTDVLSQKSNSKSRDKNPIRVKLNMPAQVGKIPRNKLTSSAARSRNLSNSSRNNDRLHDLGSKLERLRQEIRKQIHQAR